MSTASVSITSDGCLRCKASRVGLTGPKSHKDVAVTKARFNWGTGRAALQHMISLGS
jgi:hypothetical protein